MIDSVNGAWSSWGRAGQWGPLERAEGKGQPYDLKVSYLP
jgi:hypothetical protein